MPMNVAGKPIRVLRHKLHSDYSRELPHTHTHYCMLAHFNLRVQPQAATESASESDWESEPESEKNSQGRSHRH